MGLKQNFLYWPDEILLHEMAIASLLAVARCIFAFLSESSFEMQPRKASYLKPLSNDAAAWSLNVMYAFEPKWL